MPNVIEVRNLSKQYRIGGMKARNETFREFLVKTLKRPLRAFPTARIPAPISLSGRCAI